jgi:KipI family sensor histidine kinase inhibitor
MTFPRLVRAGDAALVVELEPRVDPDVNARAIAIAEEVAAHPVAGIRDVVTTYRSAAVHFDPLATDAPELAARLEAIAASATGDRVDAGPLIDVPVRYGGEDGPDLADVARIARVDPLEVVAMHASEIYRVYMLGFVPGFAYMGSVIDRIAVPRRPTPRVSVPAGSVGIAGPQTGIYPLPTPGGWRLIGRTGLRPFDPARAAPFLLKPGDRVRFAATDEPIGSADAAAPRTAAAGATNAFVRVLKAGLLTTIQDLGRWGWQNEGVAVSGAMDALSHRLANRLVGNPDGDATIEVTLVGPELEFAAPGVFAVAGAEFDLFVDGDRVAMRRSHAIHAGGRLRFGERRRGARAYVAIAGGIDVPPVFGSRATHVASRLGGFGGRSIASGDELPIGVPARPPAVGRSAPPPFDVPAGGATLRILPGPQDAMFVPSAMRALQDGRFSVTPASNRMGYRLLGVRLEHAGSADMLSDATPCGSLQVPGTGQPILLTADGPTVGGYPKIATVISADLPLAGQLAPGDWIAFAVCSHEDAVAALEQRLRSLTE